MGVLDKYSESADRAISVPHTVSECIRSIRAILFEMYTLKNKAFIDLARRCILEQVGCIAHVLHNFYCGSGKNHGVFDDILPLVRDALDGLDSWIIDDLRRRLARRGVPTDWLD